MYLHLHGLCTCKLMVQSFHPFLVASLHLSQSCNLVADVVIPILGLFLSRSISLHNHVSTVLRAFDLQQDQYVGLEETLDVERLVLQRSIFHNSFSWQS